MRKNTLSVVTCCDHAVSKEFYLKELLHSVLDIADEIIIVNGDPYGTHETVDTIRHAVDFRIDYNIKIYTNEWQERLGKNMPRLQKSIAISHATMDYVLLLDSDEIIHQDDHEKLLKAIELDHTVYATHTLHFYRDFNHIKLGPNEADKGLAWYDYRTRLFKNNLQVIDSHNNKGQYDCGLVDINYNNLMQHPDRQNTSINVYHYGHVRSKKNYVNKTNLIEKRYHPDWKDIDEAEFQWDMSNTKKFDGSHPKFVSERIKSHKLSYSEYYV